MRDRILVLHDALDAVPRPDAADVLAEAAHVAGALTQSGFEPLVEPVGLDLAALQRLLDRARPLAVFNLVESLGGEAALIGAVPVLLEARGVPFTGCPADAQYLSSNKLLAKRWLAAAGIATPATSGSAEPQAGAAAERRWIVKSVWEHASLGIDDGSVADAAALPELLAGRRAEHGGRWFAEAFIPGREINVALLAQGGGVRCLPPAEIRFEGYPEHKPRIVGYAAKWDESSFEYGHTPRSFDLEPAIAAAVAALAHEAWAAFGLAGYARVDFRVDAGGRPWVLEVNANPCLSPDAGFAAALEAAGIGFAAAVAGLVEDALAREDGTIGRTFPAAEPPADVQHS